MAKEKYSNKVFVERIRSLIDKERDNGISFDMLSELTKVPKASLHEYYNGVRVATAENLVKLSDYFKVSTDFLLGANTYDNDIETVCGYLGISYKAVDGLKKNIQCLYSLAEEDTYDDMLYKKSLIKSVECFFDENIGLFKKIIEQIVNIRSLKDMDLILKQGEKVGFPDDVFEQKLEIEEFKTAKMVIKNFDDVVEKMGVQYSYNDHIKAEKSLNSQYLEESDTDG